MGGGATDAYQVGLSSAYGYASFLADDNSGGVTVARAVAIAETAGGADDQMAVVRVRQNGQDNVGVTFYQVDDLAGTIGGLRPGGMPPAKRVASSASMFSRWAISPFTRAMRSSNSMSASGVAAMKVRRRASTNY